MWPRCRDYRYAVIDICNISHSLRSSPQRVVDPWFIFHTLCPHTTRVHWGGQWYVSPPILRTQFNPFGITQHTLSSYLNVCGTRIRMEVCRLCIPFMVRLILTALSLIPANGLRAGGKDLEEIELLHLDGHKGSRPVRIGNGAADHIQLVSEKRTPYNWGGPHGSMTFLLTGYLRWIVSYWLFFCSRTGMIWSSVMFLQNGLYIPWPKGKSVHHA